MATGHDDLEAVRTVVETLTPFSPEERQRIMRWACEKLELPRLTSIASDVAHLSGGLAPEQSVKYDQSSVASYMDIKSFVTEKQPSNDMQFSAVVAYYYAFEAVESLRKGSIAAEDLQDACRQSNRHRLNNPGQTLRNACHNGLLDKAGERGAYKINTVGENLVAVILPADSSNTKPSRTVKSRGKAPAKSKAKNKPKATRKTAKSR